MSSWNNSYSEASCGPSRSARGAGLVQTEDEATVFSRRYQDEFRFTEHAHLRQPSARRSSTAGCGSVTMYWCSTGITGTSRPTIAPVLRAKLPVAETMCSQEISPLSVRTSHCPLRRSIAHDRRRAVDFGSAAAGATGEGLREVSGLDVAVVGVLDRSEEVIASGRAAKCALRRRR